MLMVRNLCRLVLLLSVQDHKQCLCHIIFYLFINNLIDKNHNISGKAASSFRLWASKRQAGFASLQLTRQISAQSCVTITAQGGQRLIPPLRGPGHHRPSDDSQSTTYSFDKHSH
jgi:hypothetical protein